MRAVERGQCVARAWLATDYYRGVVPLWAPIAAICLLLLAPILPDDVLLKRSTPTVGATAVLPDTRNNLDA
jgi:hypothetical protein